MRSDYYSMRYWVSDLSFSSGRWGQHTKRTRLVKTQNLTFSSFFPADVVVVPGKKKPNPKKIQKKSLPADNAWGEVEDSSSIAFGSCSSLKFQREKTWRKGARQQGIRHQLSCPLHLHHNSNHQFPIPLTLQLATASWWTWWLSEEGWVVVAQWACTAVDLASGQY